MYPLLLTGSIPNGFLAIMNERVACSIMKSYESCSKDRKLFPTFSSTQEHGSTQAALWTWVASGGIGAVFF